MARPHPPSTQRLLGALSAVTLAAMPAGTVEPDLEQPATPAAPEVDAVLIDLTPDDAPFPLVGSVASATVVITTPTTAAPTTTEAPPPPPTTTAPPPPPTTEAPPPPPPPEPAAQPANHGTGYNDPNNPEAWDRLAQCESGGNWHINTGNGYYGGLQFSLASWRAVGGTGYPHEHSRETQIAMGQRLWQQGGWKHWPACTRKLGYR